MPHSRCTTTCTFFYDDDSVQRPPSSAATMRWASALRWQPGETFGLKLQQEVFEWVARRGCLSAKAPLSARRMASFQEDDDVCEIGTVNATKPSNPYRRGGASPSPSGSEGSPRSSSRSTNPYARSASSPSSTRSEELAAVSQSQAVSPHRAGQYRKGEAIGRGANGTVYQGMCLVTGKLVAIKEVQVPRGDSSFAKLRTEVQLMAKLSHANIVEYLGAELDEGAGLLSIYQEWVPGGSIDSLLAKFGGTFADSITKRYAEETLKGLGTPRRRARRACPRRRSPWRAATRRPCRASGRGPRSATAAAALWMRPRPWCTHGCGCTVYHIAAFQ